MATSERDETFRKLDAVAENEMDRELRSDVEIERIVQSALKWALDVGDPEISCVVSSGQVTLEGRVFLWAQRAHIERAVRILADVSCVFNRIQVSTIMLEPKPVEKVVGRAPNIRSLAESVTTTTLAKPGRARPVDGTSEGNSPPHCAAAEQVRRAR